MRKSKTILVEAIIFLGIAVACPIVIAQQTAQEKPIDAATQSKPLTAGEERGEGIYMQRCSLCHLARNLKFGAPPPAGPPLHGLFKTTDENQMKVLRGFILKGGPDMPGFQYGLDAKQIEDLIEYLKTI
jgi:mono/diheme cytochrome c family protein